MGEIDGRDGKEEGREGGREGGGKEGRKKEAEIEQTGSRRRRQSVERGRKRVEKWEGVFNDEERKGDKERKTRNEKKRGRRQPLELIVLDD